VGIIAIAIIISVFISSSSKQSTTLVTTSSEPPKEPTLKVNLDCDLSTGPSGYCPDTANAKVKFTSENGDVYSVNVENTWFTYDNKFLQTQSRSLGNVAVGSTVFDNFQRSTSCEETGLIPPRTGFIYLMFAYKVTCSNCKIQFIDSFGAVLERQDGTRLEFGRSAEVSDWCSL